MKIEVIGACYYLPPSAMHAKLREFAAILGKTSDAVSIHAVAMKRLPPSGNEAEQTAVQWHTSNGPFLDMSAYRRGLACAPRDRVCVLVNDTLFTRHPWRRVAKSLADALPVIASAPVPAAAGEVHPSTDLLTTDRHNPSRKHLTTFCFALNAAARTELDAILETLPLDNSRADVKAWLERHASRYPALTALIYVHLRAPANPWSWKQRAAEMTESLLDSKAVTVAVEYLLTLSLLKHNGFVVPINASLTYRIASKWTRIRKH